MAKKSRLIRVVPKTELRMWLGGISWEAAADKSIVIVTEFGRPLYALVALGTIPNSEDLRLSNSPPPLGAEFAEFVLDSVQAGVDLVRKRVEDENEKVPALAQMRAEQRRWEEAQTTLVNAALLTADSHPYRRRLMDAGWKAMNEEDWDGPGDVVPLRPAVSGDS